jgi:hypothetical protein
MIDGKVVVSCIVAILIVSAVSAILYAVVRRNKEA